MLAKRFNLFTLIMIMGWLSGCKSSEKPLPPTTTVQATTPAFTTTPTPRSGPTITPTTVSTLPEAQARARLLKLLANNGSCILPCLWGITPGKSTYQEAEVTLLPLAGISQLVDLSPSPGEIEPVYSENDLSLYTRVVYFYSDDGIVSRISFQAREEKAIVAPNGEKGFAEIYDSKTFGKRAYPYMLSKVLFKHGIPTAVLIQTFDALSSMDHSISGGFDILLLYPDQGLLVHYTTQMQVVGEKVRGCPAYAHVEMELYPTGQGDFFGQFLSQTKWAGIWPLPVKKLYWRPIEEATSMSLVQFFEAFRQPTDQCIETPAKLWPALFR
jgi:hypothetical protein